MDVTYLCNKYYADCANIRGTDIFNIYMLT